MKIITRAACRRLAWLFAFLLVGGTVAWWYLIRMPGTSYEGAPVAPDATLEDELRRDVKRLAGGIGSRCVHTPEGLAAAADWIEGQLKAAGYAVARQVFDVDGVACANVEAALPGGEEIVVVGAHYDSIPGCPAANDNGSGVAAGLALARRFAGRKPERTLRFVFFCNEEPPWFQTDDMGSLRYARRCKERGEAVVAMLSLETMGYYTDEPGSQEYPIPALQAAYGDKGDDVGFVGNLASGDLVRDALKVFRDHAKVPSHGVVMLEAVPGVGWSDHWSFWQCGYPALMVTDTAPYRYPHYHEVTDTPDQLTYAPFARVV